MYQPGGLEHRLIICRPISYPESFLSEPIPSYLSRVSFELRGFAADDGPVSVLEASYPEAGFAFVTTLVAEFGAKQVFVDMYEARSSSIHWGDVFESSYGETLEAAAERIAGTIDENFELSEIRDPNNLIDSPSCTVANRQQNREEPLRCQTPEAPAFSRLSTTRRLSIYATNGELRVWRFQRRRLSGSSVHD